MSKIISKTIDGVKTELIIEEQPKGTSQKIDLIGTIKKQKDKILKLEKENAELKSNIKYIEQDHELLISTFNTETEKLRKLIKFESDARQKFVIENQELKQQLENAIVPKFKVGQKCFYIRNGEIKKCYFEDIIIEAKIIENPRHCFDEDGEEYDDFEEDIIDYNRLFATCEKAEEALKKLEKK